MFYGLGVLLEKKGTGKKRIVEEIAMEGKGRGDNKTRDGQKPQEIVVIRNKCTPPKFAHKRLNGSQNTKRMQKMFDKI